MNDVTIYSTGCPKCRVIEKKLKQAGVNFFIVDCKEDPSAIDMLVEKGFRQMPVLQVKEEYLNFMQANKWIGEKMRNGN